MSLAVVILAAGKGTRMNSDVPKVLHKIQNRTLISFVLKSALSLNPQKIVVVAGYKSEDLKKELGSSNVEFVIQQKQLGTGHAVMSAKRSFDGFNGDILILSGDVPSVDSSTLYNFSTYHKKSGSNLSFISAKKPDPSGYGRVLRDSDQNVLSIVEEKDTDINQKEVDEINSGIYLVESDFLWNSLEHLNTDNKQNEYYLPGIIDYGVKNDYSVSAYLVGDYRKILGVNTRSELFELERSMKNDVNAKHLNNGITIVDPATTYISEEAQIGKDTVLRPNTYVYGKTKIGSNSVIGPSVYIEDSILGNNVEVKFSSYLHNCTVEDGVVMGPFCHLRPEAHIKKNAKIGNFVEIKKSVIGEGSKVPHLSYVGDATVGNNVNIGAGTITCNYDGVSKHQTIIEDDVFIGSDSMLVAPVKIGKEATTAAGSTITKDVEPGSLAIERSNQKEIKGWSERRKKKKGKD